MTDTAQWFEFVGLCLCCGKQAHGILRGTRTESLGPHCDKCADARIGKARAERLKECKRLGLEAKRREQQ
jgi:hypothetical protein